MQWCEALGTEPYLCFNFGTGTLDEGVFSFGVCVWISADLEPTQLWVGLSTAMELAIHTMPTCDGRMDARSLTMYVLTRNTCISMR
jgi:hypothetical protein